MKEVLTSLLILLAALSSSVGAPESSRSSGPSHFIFFGRDHQRISEAAFLENENIAGAQLKYTWRELEPQRDEYQFGPLLDHLSFLERHGKRLFVQLQDVSFSEQVLVPVYLTKDPVFGGGVAPQYNYSGDDESQAQFDGWAARRWDPAVRTRFIKLLKALGREVDGRIEGLNLAETALGFGESGKLHPEGFTYNGYVQAVKEIMTAARQAFPRSQVIVYANFMPGEWLPWTDNGYLRAVYAHAASIGVGVGGPDLLPYRKGQQNHSYPLIAARNSNVSAGVAVQDGNLEERNPVTRKRVTVSDLYRFAHEQLRLDYVFWGTQEPYYSEEVLPFLRGLGRGGSAEPEPVAAEAWVGTWGMAPQLTEPHNLPPAPGLSGNTLRQVVHASLGGSRLRVRFSNEFGADPVTLRAAHLADSLGGSAIDPSTDRALAFDGQTSVTIPAGGSVVSDPFDYPLRPLSDVAITIRFGAVSPAITGHPGSRTTSYLQAGDAASSPELPAAARTDHWYIIAGIDVESPGAAAVVTLGDSITDGRGSGTNRQNRWPDELARRLQADPRTRHVAVLNMGIGGNCVLKECLGPSALRRFKRDVLDQNGVRWLIVLEGVNDIGGADGENEAEAAALELISAYRQMADRARATGIRVYGATILPFAGSLYDAPEREAARRTVNAWIRTSGAFDAVIDLDAALRDPADPSRLLPVADTGDHLHPNEEGHRRIAEAVNLDLFAGSRDSGG